MPIVPTYFVSPPHDDLIAAAFIAAGVNDARVLDHWDAGHLELVSEVVRYVPYINGLIAAGFAVAGDYPGVAEYEVTEAFGAWFARAVLLAPAAATVPAPPRCLLKARILVSDFFAKAEGVDVNALCAALADVLYVCGQPDYDTYEAAL